MKKSLVRLAVLLTTTVAGITAASAACPSGTTAATEFQGKESCVLNGNYLQTELVLTNDKNWVLDGAVYIGGDNAQSSVLRIQPGTTIYGQSGADYLVVSRGSKIYAEGTQSQPIVFTGPRTSNRARGEWGGLALNGNAPVNGCAPGVAVCELEGEGNSGLYGGNDPDDNSGVLRYVRIEFAGFEVLPDNELNGISFQGVGRGTTVEHIQVHMNTDDGVEFFGGTVNVKYVLLTGNKDDSMDWSNGWTGKAQFVLVQQYDDAANHGIEADNFNKDMAAAPRSMPEISNITFIGTTSANAKGGAGMLLRRGTGAIIHNAIITGFKDACIDLDDEETFRNGGTSNGAAVAPAGLQMTNSIVYCPQSQSFAMDSSDLWSIESWFFGQEGNQVVDPQLVGYAPAPSSPAVGNGFAPFDPFFDYVDFIGAIASPEQDWTKGWTTHVRN